MWGYALFLGFTAGLFEEVGRYLAFTTILKKRLDWKNAVAFGIGHGGIEIHSAGWFYIYQQSDGLCNDKQRDVRFDDSSVSSTGRRLDAGKEHSC